MFPHLSRNDNPRPCSWHPAPAPPATAAGQASENLTPWPLRPVDTLVEAQPSVAAPLRPLSLLSSSLGHPPLGLIITSVLLSLCRTCFCSTPPPSTLADHGHPSIHISFYPAARHLPLPAVPPQRAGTLHVAPKCIPRCCQLPATNTRCSNTLPTPTLLRPHPLYSGYACPEIQRVAYA